MENVNYQITLSDKKKIKYFNKVDFKFYQSEDLSLLVTFKYFISAPQLNHVLKYSLLTILFLLFQISILVVLESIGMVLL